MNKSNSNEPAYPKNSVPLNLKKNASSGEDDHPSHYERKNNHYSSAFFDPTHFNKNSIPTERFNPYQRTNLTKEKPAPSKSNLNNKTLL